MAPVRGRPAARGTWHVPPREGLQKVVDAPTGQTGGRYQCHTHRSHPYHPNLKSVGGAVPVGRRLHAPGAKKMF